MKNAAYIFSVVLLVCVYSACTDSQQENTVTIQGTVTIIRNGMPWNTDNFPSRDSVSTVVSAIKTPPVSEFSAAREIPPPVDRPYIIAYTAPNRDGGVIGSTYANSRQDKADLAAGTYKWTMEIPAKKIPAALYFDVGCHMIDVDITFGMRNSGPSKMSEGILVNNENANINLGAINYDIVRLSGNLPVTINGEAFDFEDGWHSPKLHVTHSMPWNRIETVHVSPNGDWSFTTAPSENPEPLLFELEFIKNNAVFKKILNPDEAVIVNNADKEVSFPDIDFKTFTISGTIMCNAPKDPPTNINVQFYERKNHDYSAWWLRGFTHDGTPYQIFYTEDHYDTDLAYVPHWEQQYENLLPVQWEAIIPAFSFPYELSFKVIALSMTEIEQNRFQQHLIYKTYSSVVINNINDLENIYLGSFAYEDQY